MSDLVENHIVGFPTRRLIYVYAKSTSGQIPIIYSVLLAFRENEIQTITTFDNESYSY